MKRSIAIPVHLHRCSRATRSGRAGTRYAQLGVALARQELLQVANARCNLPCRTAVLSCQCLQACKLQRNPQNTPAMTFVLCAHRCRCYRRQSSRSGERQRRPSTPRTAGASVAWLPCPPSLVRHSSFVDPPVLAAVRRIRCPSPEVMTRTHHPPVGQWSDVSGALMSMRQLCTQAFPLPRSSSTRPGRSSTVSFSAIHF